MFQPNVTKIYKFHPTLYTKCILSKAPFLAVVRRGAVLPSLSPLVNTAVYAVPITQRQITIVAKAATFLKEEK